MEQTKKELPIEVVAWLDLYKSLQSDIRALEERAADARAHIEEALGETEVGTLNGRAIVRWTNVTSTRFDTRKAREILDPVIYGFLSKESQSRRFTVVSDE